MLAGVVTSLLADCWMVYRLGASGRGVCAKYGTYDFPTLISDTGDKESVGVMEAVAYSLTFSRFTFLPSCSP